MSHSVPKLFKHTHKIAGPVALILMFTGCGGSDKGNSDGGDVVTYQLSGTMTVSSSTMADSDVNDPAASFASNDRFDNAQFLPNPAVVGGYANWPGQGADGRSLASGDLSDRYRVTVSAGQIISLNTGPNTTTPSVDPDLDLYLFPASCTDSSCQATCDIDTVSGDVARSVLTTSNESIAVPTSGDYFVDVCVFDGAANYVLTIGQFEVNGSVTVASNADFVPGQLLVGTRKIGADLTASSLTKQSANSSWRVRQSNGSLAVLEIDLDKLATESLSAQATTASVAKQRKRSKISRLSRSEQLRWHTLEHMRTLRTQNIYDYVEPNYIYRPSVVPNDTHYNKQWHYPLINLPKAWDITTGSADVIVAVIDTGVLVDHPDLAGKLVGGYDFVDSDNDANDPGDGAGSVRSSFHGTHVAATIAASTNNISGVAGVSWHARIMPLRVLGVDGGTSLALAEAIKFAGGLTNSSGTIPPQAAHIVNLSLGGAGDSQPVREAIQALRAQGIFVVAAAGNDNTNSPSYPAAYDETISVGAIGPAKRRAPYSNYGPTLDIVAPGGDMSQDLDGDGFPDGVLSANASEEESGLEFNFVFFEGTSMATPHVAGVLALIKAVNPAYAPGDFDAQLAAGSFTDDLGTFGRDDFYGHGLIDAHKAVLSASSGSALPAHLVVSPSLANFGTSASTIEIQTTNGGDDALTSVLAMTTENWLAIAASDVDSDGLGTYQVSVNRTGLSAGVYSGEVTFTSSANTVSVPITMQVAPQSLSPSAGYQYILLLDSETNDTVLQTEATPVDGRYNYVFNNVNAGEYVIIAGTDANNDGVICDEGEACGLYPTRELPVVLEVQADRSGLNFVTGFDTSFSAASSTTTVESLLTPRRIRADTDTTKRVAQ